MEVAIETQYMAEMDDSQNKLCRIRDRGLRLIGTQKWSDCRFLVGDPTNQRIIVGHKLILAMASPVFERMFFGSLPDKTDPIVIPDVQPDAFYALMEYMYSDNINITSFDKACELCYVATKYMLPHVVKRCTLYMLSNLSPKNACRAYEFGRLIDETRLMQRSMELIAANARKVLEDSSFLDVDILTLMTIFDQKKLNIDSELDLFNALCKYATEYGVLENDTISDSHIQSNSELVVQEASLNLVDHIAIEETKTETDVININDKKVGKDVNFDANEGAAQPLVEIMDELEISQTIDKKMLQQAMRKIRFLTLTPRQFAEGPARSKLLNQDEALAILIKISSPTSSDCPMPNGFCSLRSSRCHRDMSSYRNTVQSDISNALTRPHGVGSRLNNLNSFTDMIFITNDSRKSYYVRIIEKLFDCSDENVTHCVVTFQVDTNTVMSGLQVHFHMFCGELVKYTASSEIDMDIISGYIQHMEGRPVSFIPHKSRVNYDALLGISFTRCLTILRNEKYKIVIEYRILKRAVC